MRYTSTGAWEETALLQNTAMIHLETSASRAKCPLSKWVQTHTLNAFISVSSGCVRVCRLDNVSVVYDSLASSLLSAQESSFSLKINVAWKITDFQEILFFFIIKCFRCCSGFLVMSYSVCTVLWPLTAKPSWVVWCVASWWSHLHLQLTSASMLPSDCALAWQ